MYYTGVWVLLSVVNYGFTVSFTVFQQPTQGATQTRMASSSGATPCLLEAAADDLAVVLMARAEATIDESASASGRLKDYSWVDRIRIEQA